MRCAKTLGFVQTNPCSDQALDMKKGDAKKRKAYSLADLKRIFSCGAFAPRPRITKGGCGPAAFWLPMLALFAGARLEELGQLLIEDVRRSDGIDYLVVTDLPDGNEQEDDEDVTGQAKSVKTAAGRRRIPIHSELKRLGFLAFVARRRAAGYLRLFPELEYYRDRCTKNWSRYWARLSDRHVTDRDDKAFHSFRHTFTRMLRNRKVAETIIKALVGHADAGDVTTGYGGDPGHPIDVAHVAQHWDELLRMAASIRSGTVTASAMLKRLSAYPRQNGLAIALREVGRLERSVFMLNWLRDLDLRRRTQAGLNKGEARNALARAIFFCQLGELRDRTFQNQAYRASGLNLVVAAVILWNTRYLALAAADLGVGPDIMRHVAPLGWEHLSLTGDYA